MRLSLSLVIAILYALLTLQASGAKVTPQATGIVHRPDTDIAYEQFGRSSTHTPAIIVNGGPGFSHTYMCLTDVFTGKFAQDRIVTLYDQRGIGRSKILRPSAPVGLSAQVADLEALRAKLGYEKVDLIGHSWGGELSMAYTVAYPQHVQHLVLIDSAAPNWNDTLYLFNQVFPDQLSEDAKQNGGKANDDPTNGRSLRHFLARDFYSPERFQQLFGKVSDEELGRVINNNVNDETEHALSKPANPVDLNEGIKKLNVPTLVMWGRFDMNVAVLIGWNISQAIPGAKLVIYSKSAHFPFYEEEAAFLRDLDGFLANPQKRLTNKGF
jgi:proline iminopeptidase